MSINFRDIEASPAELVAVLQQRAYDAQAWASEMLVGVRVKVWHKLRKRRAEVTKVVLDPGFGLAVWIALHEDDGSLRELAEPYPQHRLYWEDGLKLEGLHYQVVLDVLNMRLDPEGWNS